MDGSTVSGINSTFPLTCTPRKAFRTGPGTSTQRLHDGGGQALCAQGERQPGGPGLLVPPQRLHDILPARRRQDNQEGMGMHEFPIGFSSHEDASFHCQTTTQRIATGKVGKAYCQETNDTVTVNKSSPRTSTLLDSSSACDPPSTTLWNA